MPESPFYQSYKRQAYNFIKKRDSGKVFFRELCEISIDTFLTEHLRTAASGMWEQNISF